MTKRILKNLGISLGMLGAVMMVSNSYAQDAETAKKLPLVRVGKMTAGMSGEPKTEAAKTDTPTYSYTLLAYPGTLNTQGVGINPGDFGGPTQIVGAWTFPSGLSQTGFGMTQFGDAKVMAEVYELLNDPAGPAPQQAYSVNDFGVIAGDYIDSSGIFHGYVLDGGKYKALEVPFAGAAGTYSPSINNAGEIAGGWFDDAGNSHGFTLINGTYATFDFPGVSYTDAYSINGRGDIAGYYLDSAGNYHGFVRRGKTYTSVDFPGAVYTVATGIDNAGDVVGGYCPTTACFTTGEGEQGYLLHDGVYTTFSVPGEFATSLAAINDNGVILGVYNDAAVNLYTFVATPHQ